MYYKKTLSVISLIALIFYSLPSATASRVVPGTACKKAGLEEIYKNKVYKCIKLGKKLYWDNGQLISIAPKPSASAKVSQSPTPSQSPNTQSLETFSFIYQHTIVNGGGTNDELTRATIDSSNKIISRNVVLKAGYQNYLDYLNGVLLLSATSEFNFYFIRENGEQLNLKIKGDSSVAGDSRKLWGQEAKFNTSVEEIVFWDYDHDIYLLKNVTSPNVIWNKVVEGNKLKGKFAEFGLDKEKEWLDGYVVLNSNKLLVATSNNTTKQVNIWTLDFSGSGDFQLRKISSFMHADWSSSLELAISPDRKLVAYKYQASGLTPNFRVVLLDTSTFVATTLDTSRHYDGFIGPISFTGNHNLLMIPALVWPSDPNGGRAICRIDLRLNSPCSSIPGISGLNVIGTR